MARKAKLTPTSRADRTGVERHRLPGGLRVILVPMPHARSTAVSVHVRVGSRFERAAENGISHFLEHMLHRGTARYPTAHEQALAFERLGGTLAATTYVDHGVLSVSVPPGAAFEVVELLAEVCKAPVFDQIEVERGIVREEILETLDARGRRVGPDDLLREVAFPEHALGFPIAGTLRTLSTFGTKALERHHARHYTSAIVVTVAGRLPRRGLLEHVGRAFTLDRGRPPETQLAKPPAGPKIHYVRDASSQTALRLAFRAAGERDRDAAPTELLLRVIDDGTSTRLYHRVCDERGLCYDVSALYEAYEDTGLFDFAAECSHEHTPDVLEEILGIARDLAENGPRDDEIEKARARLAFQLDALGDSPADLGAFYGFAELAGVAPSPVARLRELERVPRRAVREAARRLFRRDRLALVTVGETTPSQRRRMERAVAALG